MGTVLDLALRRAWRRVVAVALGLALFELVVGLSYAGIDQNQIRSLVDSLPPALRALAAGADIASPSGYLGSGYLHPVALALLAGLAVSMTAMVARDVEDGVAEVVLSRPLPRRRWLGAHALAALATLIAGVAAAFAGGMVAALVVDDLRTVRVGDLALVALDALLVFAAIGGVSLLAAALSRTAGRAVGIAAGFVVVSYALNYLAQVWSLAEPLGRLSVFRYYDPPEVLRTGAIGAADALVLLGVAAVSVTLALVLVERRDLVP